MRKQKSATGVLAAALFGIGAAAGASMQSALDPAQLAPHIFKVKLVNERVRVLDVTIRNRDTPPLHSHPDRLIVYLNACAWLDEDASGKAYMQSYTTGDVVWVPAVTHGGERSDVVNDCRRLDIELREPL